MMAMRNGRPKDKEIEKDFIAKIRDGKLQVINAECEMEIEIVMPDREEKKEKPKDKAKDKLKKKDIDEESSDLGQEALQVIRYGELTPDGIQWLSESVNKHSNSWEYQEIEGNKLPEYFFDDGFDLSYIVHSIVNKDGRKWEGLKAEELFFLTLLCLKGRGLLTQRVLNYFRDNMEYTL